MNEFATWRSTHLTRTSTKAQQEMAAALDALADHAATRGMSIVLASAPAAGQSTLICDWSKWKIRTDPELRIVIVGFLNDDHVHGGLLPNERARISASRVPVDADPGTLVVYDGCHTLNSNRRAGELV